MNTTSNRIIPEWELTSNLEIRENEQLLSAGERPTVSDIQLWNPCPGNWESWSIVYKRLKSASSQGIKFLGAECINHLFSEIPEDWRKFQILLWGSIFRASNGRLLVIKYLYFCKENRVWLVGNLRFELCSPNEPLESIWSNLHPESMYRIGFIK